MHHSSIQHLHWHERTGFLSGRELCFLQHLSDPGDSLALYQTLVPEGCNSTGLKKALATLYSITYCFYYRNQFLRKIIGHNSDYYTYFAHQLHQFSSISIITKGKANPLSRSTDLLVKIQKEILNKEDQTKKELIYMIQLEVKKHSSVQPGGGPETPSTPVNWDQRALWSKEASPKTSHLL